MRCSRRCSIRFRHRHVVRDQINGRIASLPLERLGQDHWRLRRLGRASTDHDHLREAYLAHPYLDRSIGNRRLRARTHAANPLCHARSSSRISHDQRRALLAGISRSGITTVGGLVRGLDHQQAGIRGGSAAGFIAALVSVRFRVRWFNTRTPIPFAWHSSVFGLFCVEYFH
jgi:hypothetical protein